MLVAIDGSPRAAVSSALEIDFTIATSVLLIYIVLFARCKIEEFCYFKNSYEKIVKYKY